MNITFHIFLKKPFYVIFYNVWIRQKCYSRYSQKYLSFSNVCLRLLTLGRKEGVCFGIHREYELGMSWSSLLYKLKARNTYEILWNPLLFSLFLYSPMGYWDHCTHLPKVARVRFHYLIRTSSIGFIYAMSSQWRTYSIRG